MSQNLVKFTVIAAVFLATDKSVQAQEAPIVPPSRLPQLPQRPEERIQMPETAPPLIEIPTTPSPSFSPSSPLPDESIVIPEFAFVGNTVFSNEQLFEIAQPYLQPPIAPPDLIELRERITNLYVEQGYITSGAFIPLEGTKA